MEKHYVNGLVNELIAMGTIVSRGRWQLLMAIKALMEGYDITEEEVLEQAYSPGEKRYMESVFDQIHKHATDEMFEELLKQHAEGKKAREEDVKQAHASLDQLMKLPEELLTHMTDGTVIGQLEMSWLIENAISIGTPKFIPEGTVIIVASPNTRNAGLLDNNESLRQILKNDKDGTCRYYTVPRERLQKDYPYILQQ